MPETPSTTRTRVNRRIAADPTSTALLLAGPAAMDLWPGVRRVGDAGNRVLVEAELPADRGATAAAVRALPPRRTPTSYVTRFDWAGLGLPVTTGTLTLSYACDAASGAATDAALTLDSDGLSGSRLDADRLEELADGFLANLATAAESRSRAA